MGGLVKPLDPRIIKESFAHIEARAEEVSAYFYGRLFAENPRLRNLFPPAMDRQRDRMFHALRKIVWSLDSPEALAAFLPRLGRDHRTFGVTKEHYDAMGRALLITLRRFSGDGWTGAVETAWRDAYETVAEMMIAGAEESAAQTPRWWTGEVVQHERRGHDLAVLTVRPDQPLPYHAGQYVPVQCARWPWIWRTFSIANAPRADGLLRFHVRAVPAGWVSGALVRHTNAGDALLLGHPDGTMTLDPDSGRDILCVAGGTGLAPLKALTQEAISARRRPGVHLLFGARAADALYDLADLRRLEARHPQLRVTPVVSVGGGGMPGAVTDVLDRFGDWSGHDIYVAGPPGMVERAVTRLEELSVPAARIHHDPIGHWSDPPP
jgi:NAD(P)H-flavin reductase/hemoglobin-like flavoprotein